VPTWSRSSSVTRQAKQRRFSINLRRTPRSKSSVKTIGWPAIEARQGESALPSHVRRTELSPVRRFDRSPTRALWSRFASGAAATAAAAEQQDRALRGDLEKQKPRTLTAYRETLQLARATIRDVPLRDLGPPELRRFYERPEGQRPASRLRHLRQLSASLSAAVDEGYLTLNPLMRSPRS
jgi:hypothetical protein